VCQASDVQFFSLILCEPKQFPLISGRSEGETMEKYLQLLKILLKEHSKMAARGRKQKATLL
jgi:hypothetical protein